MTLQILFASVKNGQAQETQELILEDPTARSTILASLDKYTQYLIQVLGYTRIGDGVPSNPKVVVRTSEDGKLFVSYVTMIHSWLNKKKEKATLNNYLLCHKHKFVTSIFSAWSPSWPVFPWCNSVDCTDQMVSTTWTKRHNCRLQSHLQRSYESQKLCYCWW